MKSRNKVLKCPRTARCEPGAGSSRSGPQREDLAPADEAFHQVSARGSVGGRGTGLNQAKIIRAGSAETK